MKRRKIKAICSVLMLIALCITLYPLVCNIAGEKYRSMVETRYDKAVEKTRFRLQLKEEEPV